MAVQLNSANQTTKRRRKRHETTMRKKINNPKMMKKRKRKIQMVDPLFKLIKTYLLVKN